jgi:hypothetical protein
MKGEAIMVCRAYRGLLVWLLAVVFPMPAGAAGALLYGGIEIGAKGIKGVAIPIDESGKPNLGDLRKLPHTAINNVTLADLKGNKFREDALVEAHAAVRDYYKHLTGVLNVPPERIQIVASSGLTSGGRPSNFEELRKAVADATEEAKELIEIDQATEVELLILGAVPRDKWKDSVLVDVGSGNTKGGYYQASSGINVAKVVVMGAKYDGTVRFTNAVRAKMKQEGKAGFKNFIATASQLRESLVEAVKESEIQRKPGLLNRKAVFVSGGAPWAIAMLTDPAGMLDDNPIVKFRLDKVQEFRKKLAETGEIPRPDLAKLPEALRKQAEEQIDSVLNTFTPENLLVGSEILLGFDEGLSWQAHHKDVNFTKSSVVAWIVGFIARSQKS